MDPTACYREMLVSLHEDDLEAARKHALNLRRWLNGGGFCPPDHDILEVKRQLARVLRITDRSAVFEE